MALARRRNGSNSDRPVPTEGPSTTLQSGTEGTPLDEERERARALKPDSHIVAGARADRDDAVSPGMRIAAAWAWRFVAVVAALGILVYLIAQVSEVVIALLIAVLIAALLMPFVKFLIRHHWPKWLAILVAELGTLAALGALIFLVVTQVIRGFDGLRTRTVQSYGQFTQF